MNDHASRQTSDNGSMTPMPIETNPSRITWRDYIRIFYRGRYAILVTFLVIFIGSVFFTFSMQPLYEASVRLMLVDQSSVGPSLFDFTSMITKETMMNNQVEILKSRTLAEHVVRDLRKSSIASQLEVLERADTVKAAFSLARLLRSKKTEWVESEIFDDQVVTFRKRLGVRHIRNTDMIEIKFQAHTPTEAAFVSNAVAFAYERINQEESKAEIQQVTEFLKNQLALYQDSLQVSEDALKAYQERAKVVALDHETSELVRKIAEFETLYNAAKTDLEAARQRLNYIDSELEKQNTDFDIEAISKTTALEEFTKRIAEKESKLAVYQAQTLQKGLSSDTKKHTLREIENLQNQITALKEQFQEDVKAVAANQFMDPAQVSSSLFTSKIAVETELRSLTPKVDAYGKILTEYNAQLESLPAKKLELARLSRSAQVAEKLYILLQEKYQESRITEVGQLGNVRIVDAAKAPDKPILPKKKLNLLLGLLLGLGFGIAIAFAIEYIDDSVRSMEDLEHLRLSMIATIPHIKPEQSNGLIAKMVKLDDPEVNAINERLVTHLKPKSPVSEAYRTLRTNILFTAPDNPKHIIMLTSTGPREGKSTSVANLAITFAQMGTKTLLIDADLRRPMLHKLFQKEKEPGLTNVLVGGTVLESVIKTVNEVPNLFLLTCGVIPPNPAELLGSTLMRNLLHRAREHYEIILIDSPPIIAVTDPSVLARIVDGVVMVIRIASTQRGAAQMAVEQLRRVEAPLIGVMLNGISASNFYGSFYYQQYYYYYTKDGNKKRTKKRNRKPFKHLA
ncbi:polysaccharide biosynthesis tyrosine autokinase [candidate division KSB1 bacterium]|nr:polysaccharide biosynthesis tyrosine autokinase [candidate division KSB1 bacterium]RQW05738.1 MAG: polysaccharide biosynthesis tyrosine autokinase [candidate division KSB1 bacterium]